MIDAELEKLKSGPRGNVQSLTACETGQHKLRPRWDTDRVGEIMQRKYVCDICQSCGFVVPRPMSLLDRVNAGVTSIEDAQRELRDLGEALMPMALAEKARFEDELEAKT
jgi:hypothetical protein